MEQVGIICIFFFTTINFLYVKIDYGERLDEKWIPGDSIQYQVKLGQNCFEDLLMKLGIQGKGGQFKEWLRGAKYSNLSNAGSGFNSAKLILLEDLPGY